MLFLPCGCSSWLQADDDVVDEFMKPLFDAEQAILAGAPSFRHVTVQQLNSDASSAFDSADIPVHHQEVYRHCLMIAVEVSCLFHCRLSRAWIAAV